MDELPVAAMINYYSKLLDTETDPEKIAQYREKIDDVTEIFIMSHTMKKRA